MPEYRGINGVARKITKEYRGVDGVARKVGKAYRGIDGIARQYLGSHRNITFEVWNSTPSNITDLGTFAGFENGYIKLRSYATVKNNTDARIYSTARVWLNSGDIGKKVTFTYSLSASPSFHDGAVAFFRADGTEISEFVMSPSNSNMVSYTIPRESAVLFFNNGLGSSGTYDILFKITSIYIGDEKII